MNEKLSPQQERIIKLLFKFRYVTAKLLASVIGIRPDTTYDALERLVTLGYVTKVYDPAWRIDRKPAYYYLNHAGVRTVRLLLDVKEPVVHALYKNATASSAFIEHSLAVLACYSPIKQHLPSGSELFTKSEIGRFKQFPKNRPDIYIRTPDGHEAMIIFAHDMTQYNIKKRLNEVVSHSEEDGWDGDYPTIGFVLQDASAKHGFLYRVGQIIEGMGIDDEDLTIKAVDITALTKGQNTPWSNVFSPKQFTSLI